MWEELKGEKAKGRRREMGHGGTEGYLKDISQNVGVGEDRHERGWRDVIRARDHGEREERWCSGITQRSHEKYGHHTNLVTDFCEA